MQTQTMLDPKRWAERTFGGVHLHDLRRTRRAIQAATNLKDESAGLFASSTAHLESDQSLVSMAGRAGCHLCSLDAAARFRRPEPKLRLLQ